MIKTCCFQALSPAMGSRQWWRTRYPEAPPWSRPRPWGGSPSHLRHRCRWSNKHPEDSIPMPSRSFPCLQTPQWLLLSQVGAGRSGLSTSFDLFVWKITCLTQHYAYGQLWIKILRLSAVSAWPECHQRYSTLNKSNYGYHQMTGSRVLETVNKKLAKFWRPYGQFKYFSAIDYWLLSHSRRKANSCLCPILFKRSPNKLDQKVLIQANVLTTATHHSHIS